MRNNIFYLILLSFLITFGFFIKSADAADENEVTATVTAQNVACSVNDQSISYGTLSLGSTKTTLSSGGGVNDMQTATNTGNVNEDFKLKGTDSAAWTLWATQDANKYFHKYCNDTDNDCSSPPTNYSALTTSYTTIDTAIAPSGTVEIQLQIGVPTSSTSYTTQNVNVWVFCAPSS